MTKRRLKLMLLLAVITIASNLLVMATSVSKFEIFQTVNLFTYFGVLIGFALTIYTFGLSMVSDIKSKISLQEKISDDQKNKIYSKLISGFTEIKEDIWIIFYSILIIIIVAVLKEIPNPIKWEFEIFNLPATVNLTLFITTTIAMWDIIQTLFNLSEINLELIKE